MAGESLILRNVVDDHKLVGLAYLVTNGGFHLKFAARLETERDLVANGAGDPTILGHPRHRRESQAGSAAHNLQDRRYGIDPGNSGQIVSKGVFHGISMPAQQVFPPPDLAACRT